MNHHKLSCVIMNYHEYNELSWRNVLLLKGNHESPDEPIVSLEWSSFHSSANLLGSRLGVHQYMNGNVSNRHWIHYYQCKVLFNSLQTEISTTVLMVFAKKKQQQQNVNIRSISPITPLFSVQQGLWMKKKITILSLFKPFLAMSE